MKTLPLLLAAAAMMLFSACASCPFAPKKKSECCASTSGSCKTPSKSCCDTSTKCASGHTHGKAKKTN